MADRISMQIFEKIEDLIKNFETLEKLNIILQEKTGINYCFRNVSDIEEFQKFLLNFNKEDESKRHFGDFQTPSHLTDLICRKIAEFGYFPEIVIEPTCGKGNFVTSALKYFPSLKTVYAVDIQRKYEWQFKLNILRTSFERKIDAKIDFHLDSIFYHEFPSDLTKNVSKKILILGNPPWVTNTELSLLNSVNLPKKNNIKKVKGLDAITGKGNFDIAESIITRMIQIFSNQQAKLAMLCKTSVIRNILRDMNKLGLNLSNNKSLLIDPKKEFNVNADAALFIADIGAGIEEWCTIISLYKPKKIMRTFGKVDRRFVSNIDLYKKYKYLDGRSNLEWRQGVKHDVSKVFVLTKRDNLRINGLKEQVDIEDELVYPFLKGSALQKPVIKESEHRIVITQKTLNQDTGYIKEKYPKLWAYLTKHSKIIDKRRSVIYKNRPRFSIFGIGDYSFSPYKVAIAGMYKKANFALVYPIDRNPVMLDDTCYFLSFEDFNNAFFTWILLNSAEVENFLASIVFLDTKRPYTKDKLSRINLERLIKEITYQDVVKMYEEEFKQFVSHRFNRKDYDEFCLKVAPTSSETGIPL
ncbi:MAG: methyltransferase [Promethearchaeota archaeon]